MARFLGGLGALSALALMCACGEGGQAAGAAASESVAAAAPEHPGKATYERYCFACHAAGTAGAPLLGAKADWAPRIERGMDEMLRTTIEGIPPGMPPRGLCMGCDDETLRQAVEYMVEAVE